MERRKLIQLNGGKTVMLTVVNKQFFNFIGPVFVKRGFNQVLAGFFLVGGIEGNPAGLAFHANRITINDALVNQVVDIGSVRRHK